MLHSNKSGRNEKMLVERKKKTIVEIKNNWSKEKKRRELDTKSIPSIDPMVKSDDAEGNSLNNTKILPQITLAIGCPCSLLSRLPNPGFTGSRVPSLALLRVSSNLLLTF